MTSEIPCSCRVVGACADGEGPNHGHPYIHEIEFCPLHKAAEEMCDLLLRCWEEGDTDYWSNKLSKDYNRMIKKLKPLKSARGENKNVDKV